MAERSTAFSCWRVCVKKSTESVIVGCAWNVCLCCQCCGLSALGESRTVRPGESKVKKMTPAGATAHAAPGYTEMERHITHRGITLH